MCLSNRILLPLLDKLIIQRPKPLLYKDYASKLLSRATLLRFPQPPNARGCRARRRATPRNFQSARERSRPLAPKNFAPEPRSLSRGRPLLAKESWQQVESKKLKQLNLERSQIDKVGIGLIILSALGFGTLGLFTKLAYIQGFNPLSTLFWRLVGSAAILWMWLFFSRQWQVKKGSAVAAFFLGASVYALQANLFFHALTHASAGITTVLFYTYPAFVAVWGYLLTRAKPFSFNSWQSKALVLALLGCLLTVDFSSQTAQPLGIVLGIASGAGYGLYLFCSSRLVRKIEPIKAAAYMLLGSAFTIAIVVISGQALIVPTTKSSLAIFAGLALISTALPTITLFLGLKRLDVLPAAIFSTLEPILAVVMGIIFLQEQFWFGQAIGGLLIICSAVILQSRLK